MNARGARIEALRRLDAAKVATNMKPTNRLGTWTRDHAEAAAILVTMNVQLMRAYLEYADMLDEKGAH